MSKLQTERQVVGDYRLDVKDFGPIARASIDLRPLTVFIGPSNTGKSYLAILIYALHKTLHECFSPTQPRAVAISPQLDRDVLLGDFTGPVAAFQVAISPQLDRDVLDWAREAILSEALPQFPPLLDGQLRNRLEHPRRLNERLLNEMRRCFSIWEPVETVRHQASPRQVHIALSFPYRSEEQAVRYDVWLAKAPSVEGQISSDGIVPNQLDLYDVIRREQIIKGKQFRDRSAEEIIFDILDSMSSALLAPTSHDVYYLPADRSGVMHIDKAIVSSLIQDAATVGARRPKLSSMLADFLGHLVRMPTESAPYHSHATRLENNILQGTIRVKRSVSDYPEFLYRPEKWKSDLPLMRASSMVSELAPVVLYLRYLVRPGDVLIIEEPESHLHPAMQAVFARELARLARSGIRVVVTTHSEWLLDQFANLVRLSGLPEAKRKGIHGAEAALQPEQFGAWLFKPKQRPKGSVVEELSIDPDAGGLVSDYNEVAEQLYNEWVRIGNRIEEGRHS